MLRHPPLEGALPTTLKYNRVLVQTTILHKNFYGGIPWECQSATRLMMGGTSRCGRFQRSSKFSLTANEADWSDQAEARVSLRRAYPAIVLRCSEALSLVAVALEGLVEFEKR